MHRRWFHKLIFLSPHYHSGADLLLPCHFCFARDEEHQVFFFFLSCFFFFFLTHQVILRDSDFIISSTFPSLGLVLLPSLPHFPISDFRACLKRLRVEEKEGTVSALRPPCAAEAPEPTVALRTHFPFVEAQPKFRQQLHNRLAVQLSTR